ncbi:hypothetical protein [Sulfurospirillum multivorans]|uniref:Uncharacterized protein n=2 Tax=Sulfurospirillum multivorans TaxID=66821 RepID=A0AA86DZZ9_SULMK|nr:hypothetical protein [Sulfurospirillum multivorans]AHJ13080.1 hypothetical protein SMUL_1825 [Sulfurospirillum multivorans DSM 12446]QEH06568.1 hypothetical protein SMN_1803 [Sulfurospirillum multivorans]
MAALFVVIMSLVLVFLLYLYLGGYEDMAQKITEDDVADFMDLLKDFGLGLFVNTVYSLINDSKTDSTTISLTGFFSLAIIFGTIRYKRRSR